MRMDNRDPMLCESCRRPLHEVLDEGGQVADVLVPAGYRRSPQNPRVIEVEVRRYRVCVGCEELLVEAKADDILDAVYGSMGVLRADADLREVEEMAGRVGAWTA